MYMNANSLMTFSRLYEFINYKLSVIILNYYDNTEPGTHTSMIIKIQRRSSQLSPSSVIIDPIDKIVSQRGSGAYFALDILALIIGIGVWITGRCDLLSHLSLIAGGAIIFSSFLIIVRQYERAVVLRLGRYRRQVGPGIQTRIPFADNVLVVDIREGK